MKIAIDGRAINCTTNGIGRYVFEISNHLMSRSSSDQVYLYAFFNFKKTNVGRPIRSALGSLLRVIWGELMLPILIHKDGADIFYGPSHRIPFFLPRSVAKVVTIHDLVWVRAKETMTNFGYLSEKFFMPRTLSMADKIIAISESTARDIRLFFPKVAHKIVVVYPGNSSLPHPENRATLFAMGIDRPYFLFVGTLEPRKNLPRLIEAFALARDVLKDRFLMVIVGDSGWGGLDIVGLVEKHKLHELVILTGSIEDGQLSTLYAYAQFLAMPSLYEGFGLPIIEAMAQGTPVLTSNISSMPEVLADGGLLIDPISVASISSGIIKLLSDDNLRDQLSCNAIASAMRFSWIEAAKEIALVFNEAIEICNDRIK